MAKAGLFLKYENSFMILNGAHEALMDSHRKIIVEMNLQRAIKDLSETDKQQVYDTYPMMMAHLIEKEGSRGIIGFSDPDEKEVSQENWSQWDTAKKMQWVMVNWGRNEILHSEFMHQDESKGTAFYVGKHAIPTKPVVVPPSRFFGGSGAAISYS